VVAAARRPQCSSSSSSSSASTGHRTAAAVPRDTSCQGIFDGVQGLLSGLGGANAAAAGGLVERPAYAKRDMLTIGPLEVSPMGLGTWSW